MVVDSHHHFWRYSSAEYGWIDDSMAVIRRDFLPADLKQEMGIAGVDAVVSVQARQSVEETRWLLDLATQNPFIAGVVGWVPLVSPTVAADLAQFAAHPKLVAIRHVLQDESDPLFMLSADFQAGIRALRAYNLSYDILIYHRHLPQTIELVDRHPEQTFVVDHMAKPAIKQGTIEPWARGMRELARRPHVCCKLSGMVTEIGRPHWSLADLRPYFDVVLEAFGPERVLFGSDWPVCLVACGYARWMEIVQELIAPLSSAERAAILGDNARCVYRLKNP
ncbi:MAG TPA: amidohydrolase family protein [Polyangia bacterium]|nr:amidohydrolase family protein [Polyangia bacterium]